MGVKGLERIGMKFGRSYAAAERRADDQGNAEPTLGAIAQPGRLLTDLMERLMTESQELNLDDGT